MKMETSFYHDGNQGNTVKQMKQKMTLDFGGSPSTKKEKAGAAGLLASPDLNMLKLASPELERMIIAQNGMVTTTPTPTQFLCPKYVTEEQDAYARGFVDALAELYKKETGMPAQEAIAMAQAQVSTTIGANGGSSLGDFTNLTTAPLPTSTTTLTTLQPVSTQQFQPVSTVPTAVPNSNTYTTSLQSALPLPMTSTPQTIDISSLPVSSISSTVPQIKEEPQTVPCMGLTPPISPINMENQERIKLDRKRERNRVAARKCRTRKLERISRLEDRVDALKGENTDLSNTATSLRDQVAKLKSQIMQHVNSGCQVMMSQNLL